MTWTWCPWRWSRATDHSEEARATLHALEQREAEIVDLGEQLRSAQRRNHFSRLVRDAIGRAREN